MMLREVVEMAVEIQQRSGLTIQPGEDFDNYLCKLFRSGMIGYDEWKNIEYEILKEREFYNA